jgi:hypothetical protein
MVEEHKEKCAEYTDHQTQRGAIVRHGQNHHSGEEGRSELIKQKLGQNTGIIPEKIQHIKSSLYSGIRLL